MNSIEKSPPGPLITNFSYLQKTKAVKLCVYYNPRDSYKSFLHVSRPSRKHKRGTFSPLLVNLALYIAIVLFGKENGPISLGRR